MKHIVPVLAVAAVLTLGVWTPAFAEEEEESISASSVRQQSKKLLNPTPKAEQSFAGKRRGKTTKP